MIQIGIRSPVQREVWDWTLGQGVTILSALEVFEMGPAAVAARIRAVVGERPTYLSFDIDALDPAFAPGTGTPEIGGLATWQAQAILRGLRGTAVRRHGCGRGGAGLRRRRDHRAGGGHDGVGISGAGGPGLKAAACLVGARRYRY